MDHMAAWKRGKQYLDLKIYGQEVGTPYFQNKVGIFFGKLMREADIPPDKVKAVFKRFASNEIDFGWYQGKGTPEQIVEATLAIAEHYNVDLRVASCHAIREFMKFAGIGVDCSGLVYHVLAGALGESDLVKLLDWHDKSGEKNVRHAGSRSFAGEASHIIKIEDIKPLDLILINDLPDSYYHIAVIVSDESNQLWVLQSDIVSGVHVNRISVENGRFTFEHKSQFGPPWDELYKRGNLEIRRLKDL